MPNIVSRNLYLYFLMGVSFFGLFLVGTFVLKPSVAMEDFFWRKPVIGSIFGSICVLGILAALFPRECSGKFHFKKEKNALNKRSVYGEDYTNSTRVRLSLRGHHPDCGYFSAHVFKIGERTFCSSCTGLLLGAVITLFATFLYVFNSWQIYREGLPTVALGVLGVSFGLLQFPLLKNRTSSLRFLLNSLFVLGAFLIFTGIDALLNALMLDLFVILLIIFWIFTRISLSQWDHKRICSSCNVATCEFRE